VGSLLRVASAAEAMPFPIFRGRGKTKAVGVRSAPPFAFSPEAADSLSQSLRNPSPCFSVQTSNDAAH
jgi:hypothetical protein